MERQGWWSRDFGSQPADTQRALPTDNRLQALSGLDASLSCVHELFEKQAARTPDATAVVFENETITYAELNARANRLAHRLIELGVVPDTLVAIALERSPAMIIALLATLKAGGAYVPLDPDLPAERLAFMMGDCEAKVIITQDSLRVLLPQTTKQIACLDDMTAILARQPESNPHRSLAPENLAYVIYTSGSTGKPKGVLIQHLGVTNLALAQIAAFGITPESRVLQFRLLRLRCVRLRDCDDSLLWSEAASCECRAANAGPAFAAVSGGGRHHAHNTPAERTCSPSQNRLAEAAKPDCCW